MKRIADGFYRDDFHFGSQLFGRALGYGIIILVVRILLQELLSRGLIWHEEDRCASLCGAVNLLINAADLIDFAVRVDYAGARNLLAAAEVLACQLGVNLERKHQPATSAGGMRHIDIHSRGGVHKVTVRYGEAHIGLAAGEPADLARHRERIRLAKPDHGQCDLITRFVCR